MSEFSSEEKISPFPKFKTVIFLIFVGYVQSSTFFFEFFLSVKLKVLTLQLMIFASISLSFLFHKKNFFFFDLWFVCEKSLKKFFNIEFLKNEFSRRISEDLGEIFSGTISLKLLLVSLSLSLWTKKFSRFLLTFWKKKSSI